jgi:hypothetical protein
MGVDTDHNDLGLAGNATAIEKAEYMMVSAGLVRSP